MRTESFKLESVPGVADQRLVRCVEEALAKLPYVKWDRWTGELGSEDGIAVYGWIARDDSKADFVWMRIDNDGPWMFATSSAQYSEDISKRLNFQGSSGHHPCKRVEDFFNVTTCRKPKAPNAPHEPCGAKNENRESANQ